MSWNQELGRWIKKKYPSQAAFAREIGVSRWAVQGWVKLGSIPSGEQRARLIELTGIAIPESRRKIVPEAKREHTDQGLESLSYLFKGVSSIMMAFVLNSSLADRQRFRELMAGHLEELVDGVHGLYSEKARETMLREQAARNRRNEKKEGPPR